MQKDVRYSFIYANETLEAISLNKLGYTYFL